MKVRCTTAAVVALGLLLAPVASAASWKQVTASNGSSVDQVGLLRTGDGTLHLTWHRRTGPNTEDLLHTSISGQGTIGATAPIQVGWAEIQNAALVPAPGGIRVFFGGIRTTNAGDPNRELNTSLSGDGGATWALQQGSVVASGQQAYGSPVSATALPDGTPLEAWAGTLGTWVHAGLGPASPNHDYQAPLGNYGYDSGIATNSSGRTVMAWYSSAGGRLGVYAQDVATDGSPVGSAVNMPGTSNMAIGMLGRTPIVARPNGGFYVAYATGYPSLRSVRLWRVGALTSTRLGNAGPSGNAAATLAAAADGRLWIAWKADRAGKPHVFARRSNKAANVFGATVDLGSPKGAASGYRLDASASDGTLDIFGSFSIGSSSDAATFHRRTFAGLTLRTKPTKLHRGRATPVKFTVLDAGDPLRGAKIRAGGHSAVTDRQGRATLKLTGHRKPITTAATARGYAQATKRIRVVK
ncbi:MAG: hypothetical protein QOH76_805 [Thermoleophilaceae bacterium]|jgi:hypothetical protein|nr:hypothetical protein [Thermoleophilaceae bacterium]